MVAHGMDGFVHHIGNADAAVHIVLGETALTVDAKLQALQPPLLLRPHLGDQGIYLLVQQRIEPFRVG